jgi:hypothetical protein
MFFLTPCELDLLRRGHLGASFFETAWACAEVNASSAAAETSCGSRPPRSGG